jgi:tetratricopeptide (TPR) repeat protein
MNTFSKYFITKMKRFALFICLLFPMIASAQTTAQDYFERGYEAAEQKDLDKAVASYNEALRLDPFYIDAYYNRGWCYIEMGKNNEAIRDFSKIIELDKEYRNAYMSRGTARYNLGDYEKAIEDYLNEIKLDPANKQCFNNIGVAKEKLNQMEEAMIYYEKALELDAQYEVATQNKNALKHLLDSLTNQQKLANVQGNPEPKDVVFVTAKDYFDLGYKAGEVGEYEKAIEYFNNAINIDRNYRQAYENRGWIKYRMEKYLSSLEDLSMALDLGANKWTYNQRGLVKIKLGTLEGAIKDFEKALEIDPEYTVAIENKRLAQKSLDERNAKLYDKVPPRISITSPNLSETRGIGVVRLDEMVTVAGIAQDDSGIKEVIVNGNNAQIRANGEFDVQLPLSQGKNLITVVAFDLKGNKAEQSFSVERQAKETVAASKEQEVTSTNGKNYALLIGTNDYDEWEKLNNPVLDANAIADELKTSYKFETEVLLNPKREQILLKLKEYARKNFEPNDQLFIFVAGHGHFDEDYGEGFLVAKDSKKEDESGASYIPHNTLRNSINNIKCKHIFLVMDVCFGGTFDPVVARRGNTSEYDNISKQEFIARKLRFKTRRYLTSGGKEYVSDGRPGMHSPFARRLLEALRGFGGNDGILTIGEIITQVEALAPEPRTGEFVDNEPGSDFIFVVK